MIDVFYLAQTANDLNSKDIYEGTKFDTFAEAKECAGNDCNIIRITAIDTSTGEEEVIWECEDCHSTELVEGKDTLEAAEFKKCSKLLRNVSDEVINKLIDHYARDLGLSRNDIDLINAAAYYDDYESTGAILLDLYKEIDLPLFNFKDLAILDPKMIDIIRDWAKAAKVIDVDNMTAEELCDWLFNKNLTHENDVIDNIIKDLKHDYYEVKEDFDIMELDSYGSDEPYEDPFDCDFPDDISADEAEHTEEIEKSSCCDQDDQDQDTQRCVQVEKSTTTIEDNKKDVVHAEVFCEDKPDEIEAALKELICSLGLEDDFGIEKQEQNEDKSCDIEKQNDEPEKTELVIKAEVPTDVVDKIEEPEVKVEVPVVEEDPVKVDGNIEPKIPVDEEKKEIITEAKADATILAEMRKDPELNKLTDDTLSKIVIIYCKDMGVEKSEIKADELIDWIKASGSLGNFIFEFAEELSVKAIADIADSDPKFMKVLKAKAEKYRVIDKDGYYVSISREDGKEKKDLAKTIDLIDWVLDYEHKDYDSLRSLRKDYERDNKDKDQLDKPLTEDVDKLDDDSSNRTAVHVEKIHDSNSDDDMISAEIICKDNESDIEDALAELKRSLGLDDEGEDVGDDIDDHKIDIPGTVAEVNDVKPNETEISEISDDDHEEIEESKQLKEEKWFIITDDCGRQTEIYANDEEEAKKTWNDEASKMNTDNSNIKVNCHIKDIKLKQTEKEPLDTDLKEDTHAKEAKPAMDHEKAYNNALEIVKETGKPVIYGYHGSDKHGNYRYFEVDPIVCDDYRKCVNDFRARYHLGFNYSLCVAYPEGRLSEDFDDDMTDEEFIEELGRALKESRELDENAAVSHEEKCCCCADPESSVKPSEDVPVVKCPVNDIITHSEDEKPLDCRMEKKPLEKPLTETLEEDVTDKPEEVQKVADLIKDEVEAIDGYKDAKEVITDPETKEVIDHIEAEEVEHIDELAATIDEVKEPIDKPVDDHEFADEDRENLPDAPAEEPQDEQIKDLK